MVPPQVVNSDPKLGGVGLTFLPSFHKGVEERGWEVLQDFVYSAPGL